eukprot:4668631-Alexandrium_andersonii.AAC.1
MPSTFRYVRVGDGNTWRWDCHGRSRRGFPSARAAAEDLARRIVVPVQALSRTGKTSVHKTSSTPGVSWRRQKLGWVCRSGAEG